MRTWNRPKYPAPLAANPPLSNEMIGWLDGREERNRNWDAKALTWLQRHASRSVSCSNPILSKRMIVTGLTLKGRSALTTFHSYSSTVQASALALPPQIERPSSR